MKRVQMLEKRKTKTQKKPCTPKGEGGENEFGLAAGLTFNQSREFLLNPNMWIADSVASNDPHNEGMINIQKVTTEGIWGNGTTKKLQ